MVIRLAQAKRVRFARFSSARYQQLNGTHVPVASHADIVNSMLKVGYASRLDAMLTVGPWRSDLLTALVEGYLRPDLRPTDYFLALEPSERVSMTFLLAQAFTHWAASHHLSVPILLHVVGAAPNWTLAAMPATAKLGAGPVKDKSRPDFIGVEPGGYHVFESKGRSYQPGAPIKSATAAARCTKDALAQVSRIATINGAAPITRTAAVWILRPHELRGYLTDPPRAAFAYDLSFDLRLALLKYYRLILDARTGLGSVYRGSFVRLPFGKRLLLVVDAKLLSLLEALEKPSGDPRPILDHLERRAHVYVRLRRLAYRRPDLSFGLDGTGIQLLP
ncbi:hypothetical protein [Sphingopyxis sp.]|uniref:hypothetical protein n=1 Tax=Sphingopyxis sp. TaxID=1908224 RepID=UPI002E04D141|nr:hypothetical protein [Sphingopyxis sp.]